MNKAKALVISYAKVALDNELVVYKDKVTSFLGLVNLRYGMSVCQGKSVSDIQDMFYKWLSTGRY